MLAALCAAVMVAWVAWHRGAEPALMALTAAACAAPAGALAWRLAQQAPATLRWDGQTWQADGQAAKLALMLDLGSVLVLRWQTAEGGDWAWTAVSARETGSAWHALRTALWAHAAKDATRTAPW